AAGVRADLAERLAACAAPTENRQGRRKPRRLGKAATGGEGCDGWRKPRRLGKTATARENRHGRSKGSRLAPLLQGAARGGKNRYGRSPCVGAAQAASSFSFPPLFGAHALRRHRNRARDNHGVAVA